MGRQMSELFQKRKKSKIFKDKRVFDISWIPEKLHYRKRQIRELVNIFEDVFKGIRPHNTLILGDFGTGKTVVARFLLRKLQDEARAEGLNVRSLYVSCENYNTQFKVLRKCLEADNIPPPFGYPGDVTLSRFKKHFSNFTFCLFILDEIDKLIFHRASKIEELVYFLTREMTNTSIVMLTNRYAVKDFLDHELDPRVRDTLRYKLLTFPNYSEDELEGILRERAKLGFFDKAYSSEDLHFIAKVCFEREFRARGIIDIARKAGELTDRTEEDKISPFLNSAVEDVSTYYLLEPILSLGPPSKYILYYLFSIKKSQPTSSSELFKWFTKEIAGKRIKGISKWTYYEYLKKLKVMDIVKYKRKGRGRGKGAEEWLSVNPRLREIVGLAFEEIKSWR